MATTIAVMEETKEKLKSMGTKGETYDEIINKAIEVAQRQLFYDKVNKIFKEEEFVELKL